MQEDIQKPRKCRYCGNSLVIMQISLDEKRGNVVIGEPYEHVFKHCQDLLCLGSKPEAQNKRAYRIRWYRFEDRYLDSWKEEKISHEQAKTLAETIASDYDFILPIMRFLGTKQGGRYHYGRHISLFRKGPVYRGVVIHEMAHYLSWAWRDRMRHLQKGDGHGGIFPAVHIDLAERYAGIDGERARDKARLYGFRLEENRPRYVEPHNRLLIVPSLWPPNERWAGPCKEAACE